MESLPPFIIHVGKSTITMEYLPPFINHKKIQHIQPKKNQRKADLKFYQPQAGGDGRIKALKGFDIQWDVGKT